MRLLVTGATGNVGGAVLRALDGTGHEVHAGVRDVAAARERLGPDRRLAVVDFERGTVPDTSFDAVFLMRPPALGDPAPFTDFIRRLHGAGDPRDGTSTASPKIVFLSVEGVERQPWLPHARIEKAIADLDVPHVFVRPGYFMENLTTTLADAIRREGALRLPAGELGLDWVAVDDVGAVAAAALVRDVGATHLDVANVRLQGFAEVVGIVGRTCGIDLRYASPSMPGYVLRSLRCGQGSGYTAIMLLLHWLPRYVARLRPRDADPADLRRLLGREPTSVEGWARTRCTELRELVRPGR